MKNKGTKEGTIEEESFTKILNKKNDIKYWTILKLDYSIHYAIHVITKKFGKINNSKVQPKADLFIATGNISNDVLKDKDYYLDENDFYQYNLIPIHNTGISVKRVDSKKYQIHKMVPNTFEKLFGSTILGAGSSIYCKREGELFKNTDVLHGWKTNWNDFSDYFSPLIKMKVSEQSNIEVFKEIKTFSNEQIKDIILNNSCLSDFIFKGIGNFEEPYTAKYLYENGELKKNYHIPFKITTGSGRSKGDYTIVLKPV